MSSRGQTPPRPSTPQAAAPLWESHPQVTAVMLAALAENPLTFDLSEAQRLDIVELALREQKMNDASWLAATALRIRGGESILQTAVEPDAAKKIVAEIPVSRPTPVHSQEDLDAVLDAHAIWIKRVLEPGQEFGSGRANLKGNDLRAFNLEGRDLRAANLEGCDLRGCSLIAVNFAGANLSRALLSGACLDKARLRRCNLSSSDLTGASLKGADLRHAQLQGARLEGADLSGSLQENEAKDREKDREKAPQSLRGDRR